MGKLDSLRDMGINIDAGLERMLGKEELYLKLLRSFVAGTYIQVVSAEIEKALLAPENLEEVKKAAHTIKGVAANLELTDIFELSKNMETFMKYGDLASATPLLPQLESKYNELKQRVDMIE